MIKVEPAACCIQGLHWELFLRTASLEQLLTVLPSLGFRDDTRIPELRMFRNAGGERLVVVPSTGRVQLRLDLGTPKAGRLKRAHGIAEAMASQLTADSSFLSPD